MTGLIVVGAGPGLGRSVAHRFAAEGLRVSLIARRKRTLDSVRAAVESACVPVSTYLADAGNTDQLVPAIHAAVSDNGVPDVVVYNAGLVQVDGPGDLTAAEQVHAWRVNVLGVITTAVATMPLMADRGAGTFLVTGGMPVPAADYFSLSLGKAGVRAVTTMLAERYTPLGVHAASITIAGEIAPRTPFDPDDIAEHYWRLHMQRRADWATEFVFDGARRTALSWRS